MQEGKLFPLTFQILPAEGQGHSLSLLFTKRKPAKRTPKPRTDAMTHLTISIWVPVSPSVVDAPSTLSFSFPPVAGLADGLGEVEGEGDGLVVGLGEAEGEGDESGDGEGEGEASWAFALATNTNTNKDRIVAASLLIEFLVSSNLKQLKKNCNK